MKRWIAFWNILQKDMKTYYLKPPNISWGLIFPIAWTGMFFIRSGQGVESIANVLPGVVTITFEKRSRSFERLLLAPVSLELLMFAKTSGAIVFGVLNAFVPVAIASFLTDLSGISWSAFLATTFLMSVSCTFLGLFVAVSVSEVFEAQTFSNFFRFPMLFLCGLFFPIERLSLLLRPLAYILSLTYASGRTPRGALERRVDAGRARFRGACGLLRPAFRLQRAERAAEVDRIIPYGAPV